ncbi:MAG: DUF1905 domain-containing protein [Sphingobacteriales bacterium]|nr:DUF1905 domain-containing protein [Sphingobacteriales bacterium]
MNDKIKYEFSAKVWKHSASGGWHFVSLPAAMAAEIKENLKWQQEGWGRLKATAKIGGSQWETALWFDTKHKTYLLPLKAEIRKKEKIEINQDVLIVVWV